MSFNDKLQKELLPRLEIGHKIELERRRSATCGDYTNVPNELRGVGRATEGKSKSFRRRDSSYLQGHRSKLRFSSRRRRTA